jgi:murein L,D-transpeptidase YcbB/YkuD
MRLQLIAAAGAALAVFPGAAAAAGGPRLWDQSGCGSCHTLQAANASGQAGPNLDYLRPSSAAVAAQVASGGGGMPSFGSSLTSAQIQALASWVSTVAGPVTGPVTGARPSAGVSSPSSGMSTAAVKRVQTALRTLGYFKGPISGFYGPLTTAAVKRFQHASGLHADGIWGPKSIAAMKQKLG